jgi:hypothetical protein
MNKSTTCDYCSNEIPWGQVAWMIHTAPLTIKIACNDCHESGKTV